MNRFNRWFAAPVMVGALVVFSGCFAQTEPTPSDENVGAVQNAFIGQACNVRVAGSCTGSNPGTCCATAPPAYPGFCQDLQYDVNNCGACGHVCPGGCSFGYHPACALGGCLCSP
ncbi:MAG: hypothetical protein ABJE95_38850 [Byssovorax sp.]